MNSDSGEPEASDGSYSISEIDAVITEEDLSEEGFVLSNLVGSLRLNRELDLEALSSDLENTEYHPEKYSSMIYRPFGAEKSVSVLTPSSGKLAIVGAKSKQELKDGTELFLNNLIKLGIDFDSSIDNLLIQNIVANYDLNVDLDLSIVAISLDLGNVEYEPEQFPGLIYRTTNDSTVLVFGSGMSVITGANTYEDIVNSRDEIKEKLRDIGIQRL